MKPIKILKEINDYEKLFKNRKEDEGYIFHGYNNELTFPMYFSSSRYDAEGYGTKLIRVKEDVFNLLVIEKPGSEEPDIPDGYDGVKYKFGLCYNYVINNEEKVLNNKEDL